MHTVHTGSFGGKSWSSRLRQAAVVPNHLGHGNVLAINLPMENQGSPLQSRMPPMASLQFEAVAGT